MLSARNRSAIMDTFGSAVDELVMDLYSSSSSDAVSAVQEPDITSRLCQRLEDKLDGQPAGDYTFHIRAMSMPDRGNLSVEKVSGADLMLSISLQGAGGFDKSLFIQTKYDGNINKKDLIESCNKMQKLSGRRGAYVWIYTPDGVKVLSPYQIDHMTGNDLGDVRPRSMRGFTGRILDCFAGNQSLGIPIGPDRRTIMKQRIQSIRAKAALDVVIEK